MGVYNTRLGYNPVPMAGTPVGSGPPSQAPPRSWGSAANTTRSDLEAVG